MKIVLIIEDDKQVAKVLELKLAAAGFEVFSCFDGKSGLEYLEKSACDLILLDLIMPKVDGFYVLEQLQKKNNTIPVVVLTNLVQESDEKRARMLGAKEFFSKSNTSLSKVVEYVKQILQ